MTPYSAPGIIESEPLSPTPSGWLSELLDVCCQEFGRSRWEVVGNSRKPKIVDVRVAFCLMALESKRRYTTTEIASHLNLRSHASAIYLHKAGVNRIGNPTFREWNKALQGVRQRIESATEEAIH